MSFPLNGGDEGGVCLRSEEQAAVCSSERRKTSLVGRFHGIHGVRNHAGRQQGSGSLMEKPRYTRCEVQVSSSGRIPPTVYRGVHLHTEEQARVVSSYRRSTYRSAPTMRGDPPPRGLSRVPRTMGR